MSLLSNAHTLLAQAFTQPSIICSSCDLTGDCYLYYSSCVNGENTWPVYISVDEYDSSGNEIGGFPIEGGPYIVGKVCAGPGTKVTVNGVSAQPTVSYGITAQYNSVPCTQHEVFECQPMLCWSYSRHGRCCVPCYYYVQTLVPSVCCSTAPASGWQMEILPKQATATANKYIIPLKITNSGNAQANIHIRYGKFRTDSAGGGSDPTLASVAESDSDAQRRIFHRVKPAGTMTNGYTYTVAAGASRTISDLTVDFGDVSGATTTFLDITAVNTTDKTLVTQRTVDILHN